MKRQRWLPENCEPFGVCREEAAALWGGIGTTLFDKLVIDGTVPKPLRIGGRVVWDLAALKRAWKRFVDQSGEPDVNPWDELLTSDHHSKKTTQVRSKTGNR